MPREKKCFVLVVGTATLLVVRYPGIKKVLFFAEHPYTQNRSDVTETMQADLSYFFLLFKIFYTSFELWPKLISQGSSSVYAAFDV